ncbi:hypothetical protein UFOVP58_163 [uncultured Caudovirales phage]|uniref:Uncharacterized protein n=1 Tax=uncultured Caudovirales phage TaxID=2100421 RepID=A0A6J5KWD8_9CAUD|nr:hypothetical protein UFOVP58_163 [uncultured Caudovirales phage]
MALTMQDLLESQKRLQDADVKKAPKESKSISIAELKEMSKKMMAEPISELNQSMVETVKAPISKLNDLSEEQIKVDKETLIELRKSNEMSEQEIEAMGNMAEEFKVIKSLSEKFGDTFAGIKQNVKAKYGSVNAIKDTMMRATNPLGIFNNKIARNDYVGQQQAAGSKLSEKELRANYEPARKSAMEIQKTNAQIESIKKKGGLSGDQFARTDKGKELLAKKESLSKDYAQYDVRSTLLNDSGTEQKSQFENKSVRNRQQENLKEDAAEKIVRDKAELDTLKSIDLNIKLLLDASKNAKGGGEAAGDGGGFGLGDAMGLLGAGRALKGAGKLAIRGARAVGGLASSGIKAIGSIGGKAIAGIGGALAVGGVAGSIASGAGKVTENVAGAAIKSEASAAVAGAEAAGKGGAAAAGKAAAKEGGQGAIKKAIVKVLGSGTAKSIVKKIPFIGALAGLGFGISRAMEGDFKGAAAEVGSGALSIAAGPGTAASVAVDAGLAARDVYKEVHGVFPEEEKDQSVVGSRISEITDMVTEYLKSLFTSEEKPRTEAGLDANGQRTGAGTAYENIPDTGNALAPSKIPPTAASTMEARTMEKLNMGMATSAAPASSGGAVYGASANNAAAARPVTQGNSNVVVAPTTVNNNKSETRSYTAPIRNQDTTFTRVMESRFVSP